MKKISKIKITILIISAIALLSAGLLYFKFSKAPDDLGGTFKDIASAGNAGDDAIANIGLVVAPLKTSELTVSFPFTDDNEGETLVIKSDKKTYSDFSSSQVYLSVTNVGKGIEEAIFLTYFSKTNGQVDNIEQWDGQKWQGLELMRGNITVNSDILGQALAKRKSIPSELEIKAGAQFAVLPGQTNYFRSTIKYQPGSKGEFWLEALGDRGGYGLLDPWYNSSWGYRKPHTINAAAGAGTDYQVKIIAYYGSGSDSGGNVYLDSHSRTDFADVRFTASDGSSLLDYWMASSTASTMAEFWVEVAADLSTVSQDIYIYYGNSGQSTSASNGSNTFLFFDDFSGASLDSSKWLAYKNGTSLASSTSGGILTVTANTTDPTKIMAYVNGTGQTGDNVAMRARFRATSGSQVDQRIGLGVKTATANGQGLNYLLHDFTAFNRHEFLDDALDWGTNNGGTFALNTWYTEEIYYNGTAVVGRFDDGTWYSWTRGGRTGYMALNVGGYLEAVTSEWDFALIRKIVATEPAHSTWGSEEPADVPAACGDATCNGSETCGSCPGDCGVCPPTPPNPQGVSFQPNIVFKGNVVFKAGAPPPPPACGAYSIQDADGNSYNTVAIGSQCWMASNLNVGDPVCTIGGNEDGDGNDNTCNLNMADNANIEKYCYLNNSSNCATYGGLYQWDEAMQYSEVTPRQGICPTGWHLPTDTEWKTAEMALGMSQAQADTTGYRGTTEGDKLKNTGLCEGRTPCGTSGFKGLLSGYRNTDGSFIILGSYEFSWSSSVSVSYAWNRSLYISEARVYRSTNNQAYGFSVRCLKD